MWRRSFQAFHLRCPMADIVAGPCPSMTTGLRRDLGLRSPDPDLHDIGPDHQNRFVTPGVVQESASVIPFSRSERYERRPGRWTHWRIRRRLLAGLPSLRLRWFV